jgi:hypothetical protein
LPGPVAAKAACESARVAEAVAVLRVNWSDWGPRWRAEEWGIKTELVREIWGAEHRYEGSFAGWLEAAVLEVEGATPPAPSVRAPSHARSARKRVARLHPEVLYASP